MSGEIGRDRKGFENKRYGRATNWFGGRIDLAYDAAALIGILS